MRRGSATAPPRLHDSVAVSADGRDWIVINATPDLPRQIEAFPELRPGPEVRHSPISGIVLTDAELDHCLGLALLRQGDRLRVFCTQTVRDVLTRSPMSVNAIAAYTSIEWSLLDVGGDVPLGDSGIVARLIPLGTRSPRYAAHTSMDETTRVAVEVRDARADGTVLYAPALGQWSPAFDAALHRARYAFIDGAFWSDDELQRVFPNARTATAMGHLPVGGPDGSAARLSEHAGKIFYTHINNTNPLVDEASSESGDLLRLGLTVGVDGMELVV